MLQSSGSVGSVISSDYTTKSSQHLAPMETQELVVKVQKQSSAIRRSLGSSFFSKAGVLISLVKSSSAELA